MRKLHLASFKFKVGNNEFEEQRLIASFAVGNENITDDAMLMWRTEAEGTDRELLSCFVSKTLSQDEELSESTKIAIDIRQRPAAYTLQEIFKELKFGRPASSQAALDKFIRELDRYENDALDEKEVIAGALDEYAQMFPECKDAIRQAKIALNGERLAFEFSPVEFRYDKDAQGGATPIIGDGVHDGMYGEGKTIGDRAYDFLQKLLNDDQYLIVKRNK